MFWQRGTSMRVFRHATLQNNPSVILNFQVRFASDHLPCQNVQVPDSHVFRPENYGDGFSELARQNNLKTYRDFYQFSLDHNEVFWGTLARHYLHWRQPFHTVEESNFSKGKVSWFLGGRLNVSENCLDRHVAKNPDKVAVIWERDEPGTEERVTYSQLLELTCKLANLLRSIGVKKGDRVCIYLPSSTLAAVSMLACARIGAVHSLIFAGFSAGSLRDRIAGCDAKIVITADESHRGGKTVPLKKIVDEAIQGCPSVEKVLVQRRTKNDQIKFTKIDIDLEENLRSAPKTCEPEVMDSEDPLFILYTSGSTGKPKGLIHSQAGYLLYTSVTHQLVFNFNSQDVFGCLADVGWITGHSYGVYGPLANGGTTVLFESTPMYPNAGRYWETVQRLKINQIYLSPTALRLLLRYGDDFVKGHDLSSLKTLGVVGEPINHEAWEWFHDVVGEKRCPIVDTYWQTETGGIVIAPLPADQNDSIQPTIAMRPFFGIEPVIQDPEKFADHGHDMAGALCLARPWPGMARGIYGDPARFEAAYLSQYPNMYFTGDGCILTHDGHYRITGRVDDVINISGHRLGTAEVEDIIDSHSAIAESAVISFPDHLKGEALAAFIVLKEDHNKDNADAIVKELKDSVKLKIASYAVPNEIVICSGLPKTRSGKIMRRMLKKVAKNEKRDFGDTSTLSDPDSLVAVLDAWSSTKSAQQ